MFGDAPAQTIVIADAEDMPETAVEIGLYLTTADLQRECDGPNSGGHQMECDHCERIVAHTFRDGTVSDDPFRPFVMGQHTVMCLPCLMAGTASGAYVILTPAYMATDHTDTSTPPVSEDTSATPALPVLAQITVTVQALNPAAWPTGSLT